MTSRFLRCLWIAAFVLGAARGVVAAEPRPGAQVAQSFAAFAPRTNAIHYLLYLPKDYDADPARKWPLVLFLHGVGESGTNLDAVAVHGPPKLVRQGRDFPFILVSPQCPWGQAWDDAALVGLLDGLERSLRVDTRREYVTGLSMGGYGTWSLATRHPGRFAAVAPVCGGGETIQFVIRSRPEALRTLGVWAFHGARDTVVSPAESERMVEGFKRVGAPDAKLTVYPEDGHDSWTHAYAEPRLFEWLLGHAR